jgi:hypothetical protein
MSYSPAKRPVEGLGYTITIGTPIGDQQISIPLEQMAQVMADQAMNRVNAGMPGMVDGALARVKPFTDAEYKRWNSLVNSLINYGNTLMAKSETALVKGTKYGTMAVGIIAAVGLGVVAFSAIKKKKAGKV